MRVFVTGTGRCGTVTFARACKHITNYTSAHETQSRRRTVSLDYPDNHIEVDPHFAHYMGPMIHTHPGAMWVHLWRDRDAVIRSIMKKGNLQHWSRVALWRVQQDEEVATLVHDALYSNIRAHLIRSVQKKLHIETPVSEAAFRDFWNAIGAEGDLGAACKELEIKHNRSRK